MAVIKIVPMPGAEGQQGETGAVGPQGPQGETGATGPAGADAVWYYNGEYNPGASYVIGDVVTYDGQLWYRKHANGGNVGDTPSEGFIWDLLAAKGADGEPGQPGQDATSIIDSGSWGHDFFEESELQTSTYSTYADYYTIGELVFFDFSADLQYVNNWGSEDLDGNMPSWKLKLPFSQRNKLSSLNSGGANIVFNGMIIDRNYTNDEDPSSTGRHIIFGKISGDHISLWGIVHENSSHYSKGEMRPVTSVFPADFTEGSGGPSKIKISGVYRKE